MGSLTADTSANLGVSEYRRRRPRLLCLHGFRTSGEIMRTQVMAKWPDRVTARLDLFFANAPFPAEGKSEVEGIFDPPYYEWFQFIKGFTEFRNFDECLAYIEVLMIEHGPFDGLMGFSQGAALSAALPGLQAKGLALKRVPQVKNVLIIGGGKIPAPVVAEKAFDVKIKCPSLHFIGELDFLKEPGEALLDAFVDPVVVRHPRGHTVPRLVCFWVLHSILAVMVYSNRERRKRLITAAICLIVEYYTSYIARTPTMSSTCSGDKWIGELLLGHTGRYYLVDAGYPMQRGFLKPFADTRYHIPDFERAGHTTRGRKEMFNKRHSSLRGVIERTFGVWKKKWVILRDMPTYSFNKQVRIVAATMTLHNYIRRHHSQDDIEFNIVDEDQSFVPPEAFEYRVGQSLLDIDQNVMNIDVQDGDGAEEMVELREMITNALVNE